MVYSYDNWVQLPTKLLYDTHIMNMSLAAAKDMYDKGQQAIKDFYTTYGDFVTPIEADQDWYNENVTGAVRNAINNIYARGGDPLRNAADRAEMLKAIYNVPVGEAAKRRSSAKVAEEYVKNRGILDAAGKYNPQLEAYLGRDLSKWDTGQNGIWQFSSPTENKTMDDIIEPIIKNLEYSYDEARTKEANDGNDYYTVTEDRIRSTIDDAMPDLMQNRTIGGYYYNQALQQTGDPELAKQLYTQWLVDRGRDHLKEKFVPNEYKKMDREFQYKKELENMRYRHDLSVAREKASGSGNGGGSKKLPFAYDSAEGLFYRGLIHSGDADYIADTDVEKAVEQARDNIVERQMSLLIDATAKGLNGKQSEQYLFDNLSIKESPDNFFKYATVNKDSKTGAFYIDEKMAKRMFSDESIISHMYGVQYGGKGSDGKMKYKKMYTNREGLVGKIGFPGYNVTTGFVQKANGDYALRQFWEIEVGHENSDGEIVKDGTMRFEMPTSRDATHNMPEYREYKKLNGKDQKVIIRPTLREDPVTRGWKNSGSVDTNVREHVPAEPSFWGTSNNEAFEER